MRILKACFFGILVLFGFLFSTPAVKAEPLLVSWGDGLFYDTNSGGHVSLILTPTTVTTGYANYFVYVPTSILTTLDTITLTAYKSDYSTIRSIALVSSNTSSPNVFCFTFSTGDSDYWLYLGRIGVAILTSQDYTSVDGASFESEMDTNGRIYVGTGLNLARLPAVDGVVDSGYFFRQGYDAGYEDGETEGYSEGYDYGVLDGSEVSMGWFVSIWTGIGAIFSIEIFNGVTLGFFMLFPLVIGVVRFVLSWKHGG